MTAIAESKISGVRDEAVASYIEEDGLEGFEGVGEAVEDKERAEVRRSRGPGLRRVASTSSC